MQPMWMCSVSHNNNLAVGNTGCASNMQTVTPLVALFEPHTTASCLDTVELTIQLHFNETNICGYEVFMGAAKCTLKLEQMC